MIGEEYLFNFFFWLRPNKKYVWFRLQPEKIRVGS